MNWKKWKLGLLVAGLTGLFNGVVCMVVDMTAKQIAFVLIVSFAKDALLFLKQHPAEQISFDTNSITRTGNNTPPPDGSTTTSKP